MNSSNLTYNVCIEDGQVFDNAKHFLLIAVGGLGVIGNILIIVLAVRYTERKNLHYLIVNMALSDILITFLFALQIAQFSLPSTIPRTLADILCKHFGGVEYISELTLLTLLTLLVISVERHKATSFNLAGKTFSNKVLTVAIWTLSIIVSLYRVVLFYSHQRTQTSEYICKVDKAETEYRICSFIRSIFTLLLYISVFIFNMLSSIRLSNASQIQGNIPEEQRRRRMKRISSAIRMVLCSLLFYSICYLPDFIEDFIKAIDPTALDELSENCRKLLDFFLRFPKLVNSCLSPIVYMVFLEDFQRGAKNMFSRRSQPANQES